MVFGDVEVFATTLRTITDPANYVGIQTGMNDCYHIIYNSHRLWADDYTEVHNTCREWLDGALAAAEQYSRPRGTGLRFFATSSDMSS